MSISPPIYIKLITERLLKTLTLITCLLFAVIVLLEITLHTSASLTAVMFFHLIATLFKRLDLFLPLIFLLSTISVILHMHKQNEIIALNASGISRGKITIPFLVLSIMACLFLYLNHQFILPKTTPWLLKEQKIPSNVSQTNDYKISFLEDGSRLIYTESDQQLKDLYWIKSHNEIWHFEKIIFEEKSPFGMYADQLKKDKNQSFTKINSFHKFALPTDFFRAQPKTKKKNALSIGVLINLLSKRSLSVASDKGFMLSQLCYKMINPWFPTFAVSAILPFLLPYRRKLNTLNIFTVSIIAYFLFYTVLESFIILAEQYVVSPIYTIILLPLALQTILTLRLRKSLTKKPSF